MFDDVTMIGTQPYSATNAYNWLVVVELQGERGFNYYHVYGEEKVIEEFIECKARELNGISFKEYEGKFYSLRQKLADNVVYKYYDTHEFLGDIHIVAGIDDTYSI